MNKSNLLLLLIVVVSCYSCIDRVMFVNRDTKSFGMVDITSVVASNIEPIDGCVNDESTRYEFKPENSGVLYLRCPMSVMNGQHVAVWPFYYETFVESVTLGEYPVVFVRR